MKTADLPPPPRISNSPTPVQPLPREGQKRSHWWVYLVLAIVVVVFGLFIYYRLVSVKASAAAASAKQRAVRDLPVVSAIARRGDMDQYLLGLGTVTPLSTVTLKSRVDGAITQIAFTEGQMVREGDFLLQIDPRPYDAALKQAQGQLAKDKAQLDSANWTVTADQQAIKDKGITEQQLHVDTATRDQDAGSIEVDQANIDTAQLNITYAHITSPITGRIGLRLVDLGNIIHSTDTTGLAVIAQLQPITVVFTLPEDNIPQIQKRMASGEPLVVDAYDRDLTRRIATGKLLALDNEVDPTTGTLKLKAQFDNTHNELFPDEFVNARMLVSTIRNAVLVPTAAIQHNPTDATFVYVVKPAPPATQEADAGKSTGESSGATDAGLGAKKPTSRPAGMPGAVSIRDVTIGVAQAAVGSDGEDTTVVVEGLQPGEMVVTDGVDKLQDGTKVIARPAPNASAGRRPTTNASATPEGATSQPSRKHKKPQADGTSS